MSPTSVSVAVRAAPTFSPAAVFSATLRVALAPSLNTGATLSLSATTTVAEDGAPSV